MKIPNRNKHNANVNLRSLGFIAAEFVRSKSDMAGKVFMFLTRMLLFIANVFFLLDALVL